ncbi:hypothetical protein TBK1r_63140 [Stieleria magnilauensis]|uniref:Uncharacterized protein n=1 Tax=Stieleria magnilauensis TaxID=2527963 RepID=A0ABX5XZ21_9BACT|nr:hypothetical protein TBK1r_63140 [Planctomycetes bacterium TBK1r]
MVGESPIENRRVTEWPRMFRKMKAKIKAGQTPEVTNITIVVIEPHPFCVPGFFPNSDRKPLIFVSTSWPLRCVPSPVSSIGVPQW